MTRKQAREQTFILIFEKIFRDEDIPDIIMNAKEARNFEDDPYIESTITGVFNNLVLIDENISKSLTGWSIDRLSKVLLAVLRLAIYEMIFVESIPISVSINEAVELCKKFASEEDASYINGVLGTIARTLET